MSYKRLKVSIFEHPLVEQAVAFVRSDKLVLSLKSYNDKKLTTQELDDIRKAASRKLTHYMIPKFTFQIDAFPKTPNGKLDKKRLPDPPGWNDFAVAIDKPIKMATYDEGNMISSIVCSMIATSRGIRVSSSSSFASIGIDSLGAILFLRELSRHFGGIRIDPKTLYSAGVTIKSFSLELYNQLEEQKPDVLKRLDIVEELYDDDSDCTTSIPTELYSSFFQNAILSNLRLIEGTSWNPCIYGYLGTCSRWLVLS